MLAYATTKESVSSQDFADKIPRTRMDVRLAMRASQRYNTLPPLEHEEERAMSSQLVEEEAPLAVPGFVMEPLVLEVGAFAPDEVPEVIVDIEDDAWLNDVAQPKPRPVPRTPIQMEQLADDHTLTCWL
jgi:hypothetical protein